MKTYWIRIDKNIWNWDMICIILYLESITSFTMYVLKKSGLLSLAKN